jgi:hypothetical protein
MEIPARVSSPLLKKEQDHEFFRISESRFGGLKTVLKNSPGGPLPMVAAQYVAVNA